MATSTVKASTNHKFLKSGWGTSFSFNCPINGVFVLWSTNRMYMGVNYSDNLSFNLIAGSSSLLTVTRDGAKTTITVTASSSAYINGIVWD